MKMDHQRQLTIHWVDSSDSPEFAHFNWALNRSSLIGLDAEWKPLRGQNSTFPTVSLLQIACRLALDAEPTHQSSSDSIVFLLDLDSIHLPSIYELLKRVFVSHDIIKLGFKFKQDLVYLSSTFCSQGCDPGFEKVEPFLDITSIYHHLHHKQLGRKLPKQNTSLAIICKEVLSISLSKELQCSDWSQRPLTEEQKTYAAADAQCLIEIFDVFNAKFDRKGNSPNNVGDILSSNFDIGLKQILDMPFFSEKILMARFTEASDMVRATISPSNQRASVVDVADSLEPCSITKRMDKKILKIIRKYGDKLVLEDYERYPKRSKKKVKRSSATLVPEYRQVEYMDNWQGPPPWALSLGGDGTDGYPKFLCDVMVEGLAKQLRCVGIDAAVPYTKKPETRDLIEQACREKRVLLTRDAKLMRHEYLLKDQIYRVKSLLKNEQLLEVIETFQLKISEDQLMSRCTKCNGMFIHKPLSTEEAIKAAKGFQKIPNCLFNKNLEFWQCKDCNQLYWEGTQYHNAVQKFINICKLNDRPDGYDA